MPEYLVERVFKEDVVRFPKRNADDSFVSARNWIVYEEPATKLSSGVYLGLIFPEGFEEVTEVSYTVPEDQKGARQSLLAAYALAPQRRLLPKSGNKVLKAKVVALKCMILTDN